MPVEDKDLGWNHIKKELKLIDKSYTQIGIQKDAGETKGISIAEYATENEFGVPSKKIPARSFMRSTFDEEQKRLEGIKNKQYGLILKGRKMVKQSLGLIGEYMEGKIKKKITDIRTPPNSPITIARKGSSNPLMNTGHMRASIRHIEVLKHGR